MTVYMHSRVYYLLERAGLLREGLDLDTPNLVVHDAIQDQYRVYEQPPPELVSIRRKDSA